MSKNHGWIVWNLDSSVADPTGVHPTKTSAKKQKQQRLSSAVIATDVVPNLIVVKLEDDS